MHNLSQIVKYSVIPYHQIRSISQSHPRILLNLSLVIPNVPNLRHRSSGLVKVPHITNTSTNTSRACYNHRVTVDGGPLFFCRRSTELMYITDVQGSGSNIFRNAVQWMNLWVVVHMYMYSTMTLQSTAGLAWLICWMSYLHWTRESARMYGVFSHYFINNNMDSRKRRRKNGHMERSRLGWQHIKPLVVGFLVYEL